VYRVREDTVTVVVGWTCGCGGQSRTCQDVCLWLRVLWPR